MIIDCFLYAGPGEKNLLLAKLNIEEEFVRHFVIAECNYSFLGTYKGLSLKEMVSREKEFERFRDRITILEIESNPIETLVRRRNGEIEVIKSLKSKLKEKAHFFMQYLILSQKEHGGGRKEFYRYKEEELERIKNRIFRVVEKNQRESMREVILDVSSPEDMVFISDIDEILDCQTGETKECLQRLMDNFSSPNILHLQSRLRMWDWNNYNPSRKLTKRMVHRDFLSKSNLSLNSMRRLASGYVVPCNLELVHEYASCQPYEGLLEKYSWYPDIRATKEDLDLALKVNSELPTKGGRELFGFSELLELADDHQPSWVVTNFSWLQTNNVNNKYRENRRIEIPELFP